MKLIATQPINTRANRFKTGPPNRPATEISNNIKQTPYRTMSIASAEVTTEEIVVNLENQTGQLKQKLSDNINTAIARNDDLDKLTETAEDMHEDADQFKKAGKSLKNKKFADFI